VSIVFAYPFSAVGAQSETDRLAIDLAAARAMLGHQYSQGLMSIDPVEGAEGLAPSNPGVGKLRSASHTKALAKAISGPVRRYSEVTRCAEGQTECAMTGVRAHLILSGPNIRGDTASVTATIYQNTPSKRQLIDYETVLLTVVRTIHGWTVVKEVQLGIS
jgi:hypothetical protein